MNEQEQLRIAKPLAVACGLIPRSDLNLEGVLLQWAAQAVREFNNAEVDIVHLALGLLELPKVVHEQGRHDMIESSVLADVVLKSVGIDPSELAAAIRARIGRGTHAWGERSCKIPFSSQSRTVIRRAKELSVHCGAVATRIGALTDASISDPRVVLIGLAESMDDKLTDALSSLGADLQTIVDESVRALGAEPLPLSPLLRAKQRVRAFSDAILELMRTRGVPPKRHLSIVSTYMAGGAMVIGGEEDLEPAELIALVVTIALHLGCNPQQTARIIVDLQGAAGRKESPLHELLETGMRAFKGWRANKKESQFEGLFLAIADRDQHVLRCAIHSKQIVRGRVSLPSGTNAKEDALDLVGAGSEEVEELCVAIVKLDKHSIDGELKLLAAGITSVTGDIEIKALGVVFPAPTDPSSSCPAILSGISVDKSGLSLPAGCMAAFLDEYSGPVCDFGRETTISLAIAFRAEQSHELGTIELLNVASIERQKRQEQEEIQEERRREEEMREEENRKARELRQRQLVASRKGNGLCTMCGEKLKWVDKLLSREQHSACVEFRF